MNIKRFDLFRKRATGPLGTDALWRRGLLLHGGVGAVPLHLRVLALPGQAIKKRDVHRRHPRSISASLCQLSLASC